MANIVGVITNVEDDSYDGKAFKKVTLGDREEPLKVKQGRGGDLKAKWGLLKEGVAVRFTMTDFKTPEGVKIPFVSNIETVEGVLPKAVTPPEPDDYTDKPRELTKPPINTKNKAFSVSYAKDLVVAGKIEPDKILFWAEVFDRYMNGTITIPEEIIIKKVASMVRLEKKDDNTNS